MMGPNTYCTIFLCDSQRNLDLLFSVSPPSILIRLLINRMTTSSASDINDVYVLFFFFYYVPTTRQRI